MTADFANVVSHLTVGDYFGEVEVCIVSSGKKYLEGV